MFIIEERLEDLGVKAVVVDMIDNRERRAKNKKTTTGSHLRMYWPIA